MADVTYVGKGATISSCGRYRYRLWREWRLWPEPAKWDWWFDDDGKPVVDGAGKQLGEPLSCVFIMLNPSTADGETDDPTIRRCVGFARRWGYDRIDILNLFAYRATKPSELLALGHEDDPVGSENQSHFNYVLADSYPVGLIVCAWGAHGGHLGQDETAIGWIGARDRFALGLTKGGHPRHPLYFPADAERVGFRPDGKGGGNG